MECNTGLKGVEQMTNSTAGLTDTQIKRAKAKPKEYNLSDGKGLQLRVKPSGAKVWLLNYVKPTTGKRTNLKLGEFPDISLKSARASRQTVRTLLAGGIDSLEHRAEQVRVKHEAISNTLRAVADKWFEIKEPEISPGYAQDLYNSLDNHIFPKLGETPINQLKAIHVIEILEPLQKQGKLEMVKRICQRLNMIMDYAVIRGLVEINPLSPIGKAFKAPKKTHLPTVTPQELPALVQAIEAASVTPVILNLMKWQPHTMVRPSEAAGAKWEEIDWDKKIWNIPAERMKKKRAHSVPLSNQAIKTLETMQPVSGKREHIFPSASQPRQSANSASFNMALRRMGYQGRLVSHGFRSLASTTLNEEGFEPDLVEAALAHVDANSVRAAFNRSDHLERRRTVMQWWSARIAIPS
jgi:integrase